jgi:hypothetical protein
VFRIFLKKKLLSGEPTEPAGERPRRKNRRIYERFPIDQKHLTVMNDQDILLIRDISIKGFASAVSERAYERFLLGDVYAARMRYHGKIEELDLKVAWKRDNLVGFELYEPEPSILTFFKGLVRPVQLASSLNQVEASFMESHRGLIWYHGEDVDLHIWTDDDEGLAAWQLVADNQVIEWSAVHGVKTGVLKRQSFAESGILEPGEVVRIIDDSPLATRIRFASDIISSGTFVESRDLVRSLEAIGLAI